MVESGEIFGEKVDGTEPEQAQRRPEPYLQQKVSRLIIERLRMNEGVIGHWQDVSCPLLSSLYFILFGYALILDKRLWQLCRFRLISLRHCASCTPCHPIFYISLAIPR
jgi:hypothetical protein